MKEDLQKVAEIISNSKSMIAFTGAGISVESGIPPFRGPDGLWSRCDPKCLDLDYFHLNPKDSWLAIKSIFYDFFGEAKYNGAHKVLANFEEKGLLKAVVTQNIDNLHQEAGSKTVYEFHGNSQKLVCLQCGKNYVPSEVNLDELPPKCVNDKKILKPDFVFFGEGIPETAYRKSLQAARNADVVLVIGTTGEVMPAATIPTEAKRNGAVVIEINTEESNYTESITDFFLQGKASEILMEIDELIS
ncbi:NAD-dependent protein deacylase [Marinifilum caeruleilacunae]|uniref:protein acetyllysine N-acetyltransferase n=1 Tax=Marinifilum caeruleilacunae TaxID=2499076 RepID=A0ABX1WR60_9BACT|nr:NAD-dependent protein deacylase [Marinifilum caeruleilacunae]NOU58571.1 NAD-dependent protein deacylase [Marinifilum caeruleilacunae]